MAKIEIDTGVEIDEKEVTFEFSLSSGPGGQNVNKVATAVKLRFDIVQSPTLSQEIKDRLVILGGKRVTDQGVLLIAAKRFRSQERNRQDALDRLIVLIKKATIKPKKRKKTAPTKASKEARLTEKKHRQTIKQQRQTINPQDYT